MGAATTSTSPGSAGSLLVVSAHAGDFVWRAAGAIALAAEQTPADPALADRLLRLTLRGLKAEPAAPLPSPPAGG